MKRIFALALCLCMLLCACTGTTTPNEPKQPDDPVPAGQPEQPKAPVLRTERIILTDEAMQRAVAFLRLHPGNTPVVLVDAAKRIKRQAPKNLYLDTTTAVLAEAERIFGKDNVKLQ